MTNKEAIEVIDSIVYGEDIISKRISDALELSRSALEQTAWIPCSERLPEDPNKFVLIQCNGKYKNTTFDEAVQMATYEKQEGWILDGYEEAEVEVVAWMPLPKPYEEEKEMSKEWKRNMKIAYNKALDDFCKALEKNQQDNWTDNLEYGITFADVEKVINQLKL